jgi:hypothetical protein
MSVNANDPHWAENTPGASTADVLYAALVRIIAEVEQGYWPGIGSHGQAARAIRRYRDEQGVVEAASEKQL